MKASPILLGFCTSKRTNTLRVCKLNYVLHSLYTYRSKNAFFIKIGDFKTLYSINMIHNH